MSFAAYEGLKDHTVPSSQRDPSVSPAIPNLRRAAAVVLGIAAALSIAPSAGAATTTAVTSSNWSGYAVHQAGTTFRTATATWRQPIASCLSASDSYSSFWVGVGGYRKTSDALEQIGTELDCHADGQATSSAWFELVPSASHAIKMTIASGDRLSASVTVEKPRVTVTLTDLTTGASFTRTIVHLTLDVTSAEWIAEAPSGCETSSTCSVLPLADFGTAQFLRAGMVSTAGTTASLAASPWNTTKITLGSKATTQATAEAADVTTDATATPSVVSNSAGGFDVTYAATSTTTGTGSGTGTGTAPTAPTPPTGGNPGDPGRPGGPPAF